MSKFFLKNLFVLIFSTVGFVSFTQNTIIFKIKPEYKSKCKSNSVQLEPYSEIFQKRNINPKQLFPRAYMPLKKSSPFFKQCVDISTIYEVKCNHESEVNEVLKELTILPQTAYCHIKHYPELLYSPNDPGTGAQYYLSNIMAYEAWEIFEGDSTLVVGMVDTGIELAHDDLWQNLAYNTADSIDGQDNDGDGYTDNFHGWDVGNNDNSPEWSENTMGANAHGVFVTGMACPRTNNNIGIAGIGFKTKFLPVKINDSTGILTKAYEGIVYAADHGCKIINCSWGSPIPDEFGKDIVRYATYNRNCLIVAAAGNEGNTTNRTYYPSAYDEVLCVTATNQWDLKWIKSCYGPFIDVCAPGENVYSTYSNNSYTVGWGTSYASPLVAGTAALCWGYRGKNLYPFQIRAFIEQTCDNIDTIADNQPFANQLGKGRINAFHCLTDTLHEAVYFYDYHFNTSHDTTYLWGNFVNLLKPTVNLTAKLLCSNPNINILQNQVNIGYLDSLGVYENYHAPFIITYSPNAPFDMDVSFYLEFSDSNFYDKQFLKVTINPSYVDINNSSITLSVCANGRIGYSDTYPSQGSGLIYNSGVSLVSEMGMFLLKGNNASWCFRGKNDFKILKRANKTDIGNMIYATSLFNDSLNPFPLSIKVKHETTLYNQFSNNDFIWLKYILYNNEASDKDSVYMGLFSDIDLLNPVRNSCEYDSLQNLLYAFPTGMNNIHMGILLPDSLNKHFYAIDNDGNDGSLMASDGFNLTDIKTAMSGNRLVAGGEFGNDISMMVGYGPFTIQAHDSIVLNYIVPIGRNKYELFQNVNTGLNLYDSLILVPVNSFKNNINIFPNPSQHYIILQLKNISESNAIIDLYDIYGNLIMSNYIDNTNTLIDINGIKSGIYFISIKVKNNVYINKLIKL